MDPIIQKMRDGATDGDIHFLGNDRVDIGGVRFLCTTLWTDYRLDAIRTRSHQMAYAQNSLMSERARAAHP